MKTNQLIEAAANRRKGTALRIIVNRPAKVYKKLIGEAGEIRKRSAYFLQLANYANRKPVKDAVASGEREAPTLPVWVERSEQVGSLNFWIGKNGQIYLALPVFGDKSKAIVQWRRDGKKVSKSEISHFLTAEETAPTPSKAELEAKGQAPFNCIKMENIELAR